MIFWTTHLGQADSPDVATHDVEADWRVQFEDGKVVVQRGGVGLRVGDDRGHRPGLESH